MSDTPEPPKPPKASKKTSAVPLKKETVRVTLKANTDSVPAEPEASSDAPKPPAPAPTIPLKTAGGNAPSAPKAPAPAPTVQLKMPGAPTAPKSSPLKTEPMNKPGAPGSPATAALPKATVQLGQATQGLGAPSAIGKGSPSLQTAYDEEEEEAPDKAAIALSIVAFIGSLAVLGLQAMTTSAWEGWGKLFN